MNTKNKTHLSHAASTADTRPNNDKLDHCLISLRVACPLAIIDARYATRDNIVGEPLYMTTQLFLHRTVAQRLRAVTETLTRSNLALIVWDAYRPLSVQRRLWKALPDERYVANPASGSKHNRGCAVDVSLASPTGRALAMPTGFDEFGPKAHRDYPDLPPAVLRRTRLLRRVMEQNAFASFPTEWWHFDATDWSNYPILDIDPSALSEPDPRA